MSLDNANPTIYQRCEERLVTLQEEDDDIVDEIDEREVYDILLANTHLLVPGCMSHQR